jgi:hypothetical protein
MSTFGSFTRALYEPWAFAEEGAERSCRKAWAREVEVDDAAATTSWRTSCTERVLGAMSRSFVNCLAIPPVAAYVVSGDIWCGG